MAVDGLDLTVPAGGVFGFLGPNGAGKTTTVRCLLGLIRPTSGRLRLLGADCQRDLPSVIRRVGSIVETPAMFPGFSGRRNLSLLGEPEGIGPSRVASILELVGLAERADDKVRSYSLGMRQRLGIGASLLRDPELLILDEPANGLDPAGIREVRQLLRRLGDEGRTVFLSSHLLGEVQQLCDRVAIVARGRLVAAGPVAEVLERGRTDVTGVELRVAEADRAMAVLGAAGFSAERTDGSDQLSVATPATRAAEITKALADAGLYLHELRPVEADLETVFLELTADS
jgi:ABC-2 type transport system ATP-binding protein